jgi:hypothetical protein
MVGEGHAPFGAVLVRLDKEDRQADEPISAPKGAPFPHPSMFGLTMRFAAIRRVRRGAILAPSPPVGEGHAPLWPYCPVRKGMDRASYAEGGSVATPNAAFR